MNKSNLNVLNYSRIVLVGDSYTQHGWWPVEVIHTLATHTPRLNVKIFNCGIGGDTMRGASKRLNWDVAPLEPTHLFVLLGINDCRYTRYQCKADFSTEIANWPNVFKIYEKSLYSIVRYSLNNNWQLLLGTPILLPESVDSIYDVQRINEVLAGFADIVRKISCERNIILVDLNEQMQSVYKSWHGSAEKDLFSSDYIHPNQLGYRIIGRLFLKELGFQVNVPKSVTEGKDKFSVFNRTEQQIFALEQKIRHCAFLEYRMIEDRIVNITEKEKVQYWQNLCNQEKTPDWLCCTIKDWIVWHNQIGQLHKELENLQ